MALEARWREMDGPDTDTDHATLWRVKYIKDFQHMRKGYYKGFTSWRRWRREHADFWRYLVGRPQTAKPYTWTKWEYIDGVLTDVSPAPGRTYTRETWPPRGRGRGESLTSDRRIRAKLRTVEVIRLRAQEHTWQEIANRLGFKDPSGPYRAMKRAIDRIDWDKAQKARQRMV